MAKERKPFVYSGEYLIEMYISIAQDAEEEVAINYVGASIDRNTQFAAIDFAKYVLGLGRDLRALEDAETANILFKGFLKIKEPPKKRGLI